MLQNFCPPSVYLYCYVCDIHEIHMCVCVHVCVCADSQGKYILLLNMSFISKNKCTILYYIL